MARVQRLCIALVPLLLILVACGSSSPRSASLGRSNPTPPVEDDEPAPPRRPAKPEPPPPPPQQWAAGASLAPVKGGKVKRFTVALSQTEGEPTAAQSDPIVGLKPGRYHLAVHDGATCGKNAAAAGPVWADAGAPLVIDVVRGATPTIAVDDSDLKLDGDGAIVGHALVLHADRRGAPGKALACGVVELIELDGDSDGGDE